jgi:hypothetical protein
LSVLASDALVAQAQDVRTRPFSHSGGGDGR